MENKVVFMISEEVKWKVGIEAWQDSRGRQQAPEWENRLVLPGYLQSTGHKPPGNKKVDGPAGNPDQSAHFPDLFP
jgi:hypothetical protein